MRQNSASDSRAGRVCDDDFARRVVRAILERKYGHICPPAYTERVVESFADDPIGIRPPRYFQETTPPPPPRSSAAT